MKLSINPHIKQLTCAWTGTAVPTHDFTRPIGLSPAGAPVLVEYDTDAVKSLLGQSHPGPGMWGFGPLLPVWGVSAEYAADVGNTPVVSVPRLGKPLDVKLLLKNEGTNPTGSFKDRGLAVGVALGTALGAKRFCLPTQGNAGVAATFFSTRMGLSPCTVYMPDGYQDGPYHRAVAHYGGRVEFAGPNIATAGKAMREALKDELASGECVELSTFFEPGRLEGKKTMGIELFEQLGPEGLPNWILYPTGGGTGLAGIWKAFEELGALGLLDPARRPRMVAVQSANCDPLVQAFENGAEEVTTITSQGTVADGLDVPGAIMGKGLLGVLRASNGTAVRVTEDAIRAAFADMAAVGVPAGYEGAATLAGLRALRERGDVKAGDRVLLLNTSGPQVALAK